MWGRLMAALKPLGPSHYYGIEDFKGSPDWGLIRPRGASKSDSGCNFSQSGHHISSFPPANLIKNVTKQRKLEVNLIKNILSENIGYVCVRNK